MTNTEMAFSAKLLELMHEVGKLKGERDRLLLENERLNKLLEDKLRPVRS